MTDTQLQAFDMDSPEMQATMEYVGTVMGYVGGAAVAAHLLRGSPVRATFGGARVPR